MAQFSIHFVKDDGVVVPHPARRYPEGTRLRYVMRDASRHFPDRRFAILDSATGAEWFRHEPEASTDTQPAVFR